MLPSFAAAWHHIHEVFADPAFVAFLDLLLVPIVVYEVLAHRADRKHLKIAKDTYLLYKEYFEVTEQRKREAREKAAATRAAKRAALLNPPGDEPPVPPEGEVPPPMSMPDEEEHEEES